MLTNCAVQPQPNATSSAERGLGKDRICPIWFEKSLRCRERLPTVLPGSS
jgi:hypothetical protein